LISASQRRRIL